MFEQSLYEPQEPQQPERIATPPEEGDFLYGYEIKNWQIGPRIYKILAVSAAANLLAMLIVAQTSLLTMKGCDSPLVGGVCKVLDTVYVGAMLWGTERDYIDAAYDKTELGEDYDVTFVDMTGATPPLSYPDGYFQVANRDELAALAALATDPTMTSGIPGIPDGIPMSPPSFGGGSMLDTTPNLPKSNPNTVEGELPSGFGNNDQTAGGNLQRPQLRPKRPKTNTPKNPDGATPPTPNENQVAEVKASPTPTPTAEPTDPVAGIQINRRPFVDLANQVIELIDKNQVKLDSPFIITATGKLNKDGKIDAKSFRYIDVQGTDQNMVEVVRRGIEAVNQSNLLQHLILLQGNQLGFQVKQDDLNVAAAVQTDFKDNTRAESVASSLRMAIEISKQKKLAPDASQNDKDDLLLLQNAAITVAGNRLTLSFTIPKVDLQPLIQRKLAEQKNAPKEPNSGAPSRASNNTASN